MSRLQVLSAGITFHADLSAKFCHLQFQAVRLTPPGLSERECRNPKPANCELWTSSGSAEHESGNPQPKPSCAGNCGRDFRADPGARQQHPSRAARFPMLWGDSGSSGSERQRVQGFSIFRGGFEGRQHSVVPGCRFHHLFDVGRQVSTALQSGLTFRM